MMKEQNIKIIGKSSKSSEGFLLNSFPLLPFPFDLVYLGLK